MVRLEDHRVSEESASAPTHRWSRRKRLAVLAASAIVAYAAVAYLVLPRRWKRYARRNPSLEEIPNITYTASGIPGDPLNIALIGPKAELIKTMLAAKWHPADPLSLRSCLEIAEATLFKRSYQDAPVSSLYLFGRKEDLAFEQPVGDDPRHRHHVRFWKTGNVDDQGRPIWIGSAVYDKHVGLSRTTGQITHITGADVDAERDYLLQCLKQTGKLAEHFIVEGYHKILEGRNGGGDPWRTDGNLDAAVIAGAAPR